MRAGPFLLFASREQRKVQKYENGTDRVSASRLYLIAEAFGVGIGFFYGLDDAAAGIDTAAVAGSIGLLGKRYAIEVSNAFAT
jgi:transcriptional regulator with XRE-family HTH domain